MKKTNKLLFILVLSALAACTKIKNEPKATESSNSEAKSSENTSVTQNTAPVIPNGKIFTFRLLGDPETLDWNRAHTSVETHLLINLMEGLVTYDKDLGIIPALAETWTRSGDGKTYTFKLRKGVKWSDGVPLTAKDFVYSWKRLLSPVTSASYAYLLFEVQGAEDFYKGKNADFGSVGISAPDDSTFVVKLRNPVAYFLHIPTFWVTFPLREDIVTTHGNSWAKPGKMATVGPYTLSSYDVDSKIVLKANPYYYGERGNIETAIGLIVKEDSTALTLFETGKIDFLTDLSSSDIVRLEKDPRMKTFPYLKTGYVGFVHNKFPMSNVHFRKAIAHAIDKKRISEILHGGQKAASGFIPFGMVGYQEGGGLAFDPALAKKELKLSGVEPSSKVTLEITCPNWEKAMTLSQFIQGEVKKNLGIDLQIQAFDHKTFRSQLELYNYPMFLLSWSADYPDPDNFMSVFMSGVGNNRTTWKNELYDQKVLKARTELNPKARMMLYADAQKILVETDAAIMPLYHEPILALVQPKVSGLQINPLNYIFMKKVTVGE